MILYGIKNCDTVKKARLWFDNAQVPYQFHDFKKDGLSEAVLDNWLQRVSWETLLNKRGTTWRAVDEDIKKSINADNARVLMLANPSIIKRPVVDTGTHLLVGFDIEQYTTLVLNQ